MKPTYRVAVLQAGTLLRYWVDAIPQCLIKPLVLEGHAVDYFLGLNTEDFTPFKKYARSIVPDPAIASLMGPPGIWETALLDLLNVGVSKAGGALRYLNVYANLSVPADVINDFDRSATGWNRNRSDTRATRTNVFKLVWEMEELWHQLRDAEAVHGRYEFVITQRDDSFWFEPFSLDALLAVPPETSAIAFESSSPVQAFNLRCLNETSTYDANMNNGFNDYTLILKREVVWPFGWLYTRLVRYRENWAVANLEAFLKLVAAGVIPV